MQIWKKPYQARGDDKNHTCGACGDPQPYQCLVTRFLIVGGRKTWWSAICDLTQGKFLWSAILLSLLFLFPVITERLRLHIDWHKKTHDPSQNARARLCQKKKKKNTFRKPLTQIIKFLLCFARVCSKTLVSYVF